MRIPDAMIPILLMIGFFASMTHCGNKVIPMGLPPQGVQERRVIQRGQEWTLIVGIEDENAIKAGWKEDVNGGLRIVNSYIKAVEVDVKEAVGGSIQNQILGVTIPAGGETSVQLPESFLLGNYWRTVYVQYKGPVDKGGHSSQNTS